MNVSRLGVTILLVVITLYANETLVSGFPLLKFRKYHVSILNGLQVGNNKNALDVHCKSKDNDLGFQRLALNQKLEWEFRTNFHETTLFFCGFTWSKGQKVFDAFKDDPEFIDGGCGGRHCAWKAQEDGIYLFNIKESNFKLVYKWDQRD